MMFYEFYFVFVIIVVVVGANIVNISLWILFLLLVYDLFFFSNLWIYVCIVGDWMIRTFVYTRTYVHSYLRIIVIFCFVLIVVVIIETTDIFTWEMFFFYCLFCFVFILLLYVCVTVCLWRGRWTLGFISHSIQTASATYSWGQKI